MTEDQIPLPWRKGMQRALDRHIKATLCADGTFRVRSGSTAGRTYQLTLDEHGKVGPCDAECMARKRFGDDYVCAHRGAVALAVFALRGIVGTTTPITVVESASHGRSQVYREAA